MREVGICAAGVGGRYYYVVGSQYPSPVFSSSLFNTFADEISKPLFSAIVKNRKVSRTQEITKYSDFQN